MKRALSLLVVLLFVSAVEAQVHLTWWIQENGLQRWEPARPGEVVISVPRSNPRAYVWLVIRADAPNQHFNDFWLSLDCGNQFQANAPYASPWSGRSLWYYTNHPIWWYPQHWYAPADALCRATQYNGVLYNTGDTRWVGMIRFWCYRGPGEYLVTPLGQDYWYWPTRVRFNEIDRPLTMDKLRIIVRP